MLTVYVLKTLPINMSINDVCFCKFKIAKKIIFKKLTGITIEYQDLSVILDFNLEIVSRAAP